MGIVTNNVREYSERWRRMIPVDELFDDIVDSSSVGVRKPNPEIYRLALRRLRVDPARGRHLPRRLRAQCRRRRCHRHARRRGRRRPSSALDAIDQIIAGGRLSA